ncbi:hypothetical protein SAMN04489735_100856 [Aneurinibacillus thermoaerophilus]|uniref:Uncharacterized protein n=1 Tax=Aneurinibacillus thermoaerophilus TaxID=143495 RepID=A0A1G7YXK7_ANETH|nr:hypothetical protein SAMN04489735_100856 [Aneurinibacillus thermoaerophilus]
MVPLFWTIVNKWVTPEQIPWKGFKDVVNLYSIDEGTDDR